MGDSSVTSLRTPKARQARFGEPQPLPQNDSEGVGLFYSYDRLWVGLYVNGAENRTTPQMCHPEQSEGSPVCKANFKQIETLWEILRSLCSLRMTDYN